MDKDKRVIPVSLANPDEGFLEEEFNIVAAEVRECGIIVEHNGEDAYLVENTLGSYDLMHIKDEKCYWHGRVKKDGSFRNK